MIHIAQNPLKPISAIEADIILALAESTYLTFLVQAGYSSLQGEKARAVDNFVRAKLRTWLKAKFPDLALTVDDA